MDDDSQADSRRHLGEVSLALLCEESDDGVRAENGTEHGPVTMYNL